MPSDAELPERLGAVAAVVHLVFTAGYAGAPDSVLLRVDLCDEAIRLARLLNGLLPGEPTLQGLLAALLFPHSRRYARLDGEGELVLLADQDRSRWNAAEIAEAHALLVESLRRSDGLADRYQLEAAIASQHVTGGRTDWAEVVRLYDLLLEVAPSPAVHVNRAVAVAEVSGPAAALALLDGLPPTPRLAFQMARADLLRRLGRTDDAAVAYWAALEEAPSAPEGRFLRRRLAELETRRQHNGGHGPAVSPS